MMCPSLASLKRIPRRGAHLLLSLCCALLLAGSSVGIAQAHKPLFKDRHISSLGRAFPIPDPSISWAIYASLDRPGEADYFSFHAHVGLALDAQITIPAIRSLQQFAPHLALVGPGLTPLASGAVPFAVPAGAGVELMDASQVGTADRFDEPFTQTTYWIRQTLKKPLATAGTYYLVVFNHPTDTIQTGKYVLAVGDIEQFGPADLVTFPGTYIHVRVFTEAGPPVWSWIVLAVIVLLSIGVMGWRRRRHKKRYPVAVR